MEFRFERLNAWKQAREIVKIVYRIVKRFPPEERYALSDQIRRAAVSVASNIAEGSGRTHKNDRVRFVEIAYGSLMETYNQLVIAADLGYITEQEVIELKPLFFTEAKMLSGLRKRIESEE